MVQVTGRDGQPRQRSVVSFNTFGHTCASLLFEHGRNVKQVAEWLGHADPGFTLRTYVHLMDEGVGDADSWTRPSPLLLRTRTAFSASSA